MDIRVGKAKSHRDRKSRAGREQWQQRKADRNKAKVMAQIANDPNHVWTNLGPASDIKDGETVCEHGQRPFDCRYCRPL